MKRIVLVIVSIVLVKAWAFGQGSVSAQDGLPSNPEDGKCYAKCIEPDEYKEEAVKVMTKPAYKKLEIVPAEYKTEVEKIVVKPASKKYTYVPATYKTVYDTIWTKDTYNKLSIVPADFRDDLETVEIKSAYGKWVAGEKDPDCPSIDPDDCRVFHYKEYPAVSRDVGVERLVKNETPDSKEIVGKYVVESREVEVTPARYDEEAIPEVTKEITKSVLVKDESTKQIDVPAEYSEVTKRVLVKAGGMSVWKEVPCTVPDDAIVLPIVWNLGSAELTASAKSIIDNKLIVAAKKKKGTIVEVGSHTDARGSSESNQRLSEKRAKSVAEYLISEGIDKERIIAIGYGESNLKNECADGVSCNESKHSANRRTEFKLY